MNSSDFNLPLVTVCILAFNHEKYIVSSIRSALEQTYKNVEIIIIDNKSNDKTVDVIEKEFTRELKSKRIKLYKSDSNTFPSHGTNFGLSKAKGKYICLLSGDDSFSQNKLQRQVEVMLEGMLSNLFTWVNIIDDDDNIISISPLESIFNRDYSSQDIKEHFIRDGNMLCALSCMFDRTIFKRYGYFDERLVQLQDFDLWLRIISHEELNLLTERLTNYRERGDGCNLSLISQNERHFRTEFEEIYTSKHLLNFDNITISNAISCFCTDENKYELLIKYYLKSKKLSIARGVLFSLYERLGSRIIFPSKEYNVFFNAYSKIDFFNNATLIELQKEITRLRIIENSKGWKFVKLLRNLSNRFGILRFLSTRD